MNILNRKTGKFFLHLISWIFLWLVFSSWASFILGWNLALKFAALIISGMAGLVYLNSNILLPHFFIKKGYVIYLSLVIISIIGVIYLTSFADDIFLEHIRNSFPDAAQFDEMRKKSSPPFYLAPRVIMKFTMYSFAIFINTVLWITRFAQSQKQLAIKMKSEKMEAEMKFLKNQINPHFLFNVLNSIYSLALSNNKNTADVVMKLSEMLRYVLYETNIEKVSLNREMKYIQNFIDLQKLKEEEEIAINFQMETSKNPIMIAPMLLVTFVENAFKHGNITDIKNGWINIFVTSTAQTIHFKIDNSLPTTSIQKDKTSGIGLQNVKRRLKLLYPQKHQLRIDANQNEFKVDLKINLS